jgi:hypothetical protein
LGHYLADDFELWRREVSNELIGGVASPKSSFGVRSSGSTRSPSAPVRGTREWAEAPCLCFMVRSVQNFLYHPKTTAHDRTVFSVNIVVRALIFMDELESGMS